LKKGLFAKTQLTNAENEEKGGTDPSTFWMKKKRPKQNKTEKTRARRTIFSDVNNSD